MLVSGLPLHRTNIAIDPKTPVKSSDMVNLFKSKYPVASIGLNGLMNGKHRLAEEINSLADRGNRVIVIDCVTQEDLDLIADAAITSRRKFIAVDPGVFTATLARKLITPNEKKERFKILSVVGSVNPNTTKQMEELWLAQHPIANVFVETRKLLGSEDEREAEISRVTSEVLKKAPFNTIMTVTGDGIYPEKRIDFTPYIRDGGSIEAVTCKINASLKLFGRGREKEALAFTGFLVSIPIFCDSGFVVLASIAKALSRVTKKSLIALGVSLATGLVITHSLVPPSPGPLGVCGIFGVDVGLYILASIVLALPMAIGYIMYARMSLAKKYYWLQNENDEIVQAEYQKPDYDAAFSMDMTGGPGTLESFIPLILLIILILINTVATALKMTSCFMQTVIFWGQPIVAVGLGLLVAIFTLARTLTREEALADMEKGMASAGIILLVTGGGGALGRIIQDSGLGTYMAKYFLDTSIPLVFLPLVISTAMRFVQSSGTVAMVTAASITAPILNNAGVNPLLGVIACCVGSLFFGYFNDSY